MGITIDSDSMATNLIRRIVFIAAFDANYSKTASTEPIRGECSTSRVLTAARRHPVRASSQGGRKREVNLHWQWETNTKQSKKKSG